MEIFINEVSLEGQYLTELDFREAIKVFNSIFVLISSLKDIKLFKDDSNVYANYEAIKGAHIEVFDARGLHIGEADLQGNIDTTKKDKDKTINVS
jgi:hypothetical protein